jgi:hypothetical protein
VLDECDTPGEEFFSQQAQHAPWIEMSFQREEQGPPESPSKSRLQRGDLLFAQPFMAAGATGKAIEFVLVARGSNDQRSVSVYLARQHRVPPVYGIAAAQQDGFVPAFTLTPGREHAAREPGGCLARARIRNGDVDTTKAEFVRDRKAGNAGPFD